MHKENCPTKVGEWSGSPARGGTGWRCDACAGFIPCEPLTFTVYSSHGEIVVRLADGMPIQRERYDPTDEESAFIDQIERFDMDAYCAVFPEVELHVDILETAYWIGGRYVWMELSADMVLL